jgi:hypothetical protein
MHVLPLQQPPVHEPAVQTHCPPALHVWPNPHAPHTAPPAPQEVGPSLVRPSHAPASSQHPEHDVPPHEHVPLAHASPLLQPPQAAPPVPHWVVDWDV